MAKFIEVNEVYLSRNKYWKKFSAEWDSGSMDLNDDATFVEDKKETEKMMDKETRNMALSTLNLSNNSNSLKQFFKRLNCLARCEHGKKRKLLPKKKNSEVNSPDEGNFSDQSQGSLICDDVVEKRNSTTREETDLICKYIDSVYKSIENLMIAQENNPDYSLNYKELDKDSDALSFDERAVSDETIPFSELDVPRKPIVVEMYRKSNIDLANFDETCDNCEEDFDEFFENCRSFAESCFDKDDVDACICTDYVKSKDSASNTPIVSKKVDKAVMKDLNISESGDSTNSVSNTSILTRSAEKKSTEKFKNRASIIGRLLTNKKHDSNNEENSKMAMQNFSSPSTSRKINFGSFKRSLTAAISRTSLASKRSVDSKMFVMDSSTNMISSPTPRTVLLMDVSPTSLQTADFVSKCYPTFSTSGEMSSDSEFNSDCEEPPKVNPMYHMDSDINEKLRFSKPETSDYPDTYTKNNPDIDLKILKEYFDHTPKKSDLYTKTSPDIDLGISKKFFDYTPKKCNLRSSDSDKLSSSVIDFDSKNKMPSLDYNAFTKFENPHSSVTEHEVQFMKTLSFWKNIAESIPPPPTEPFFCTSEYTNTSPHASKCISYEDCSEIVDDMKVKSAEHYKDSLNSSFSVDDATDLMSDAEDYHSYTYRHNEGAYPSPKKDFNSSVQKDEKCSNFDFDKLCQFQSDTAKIIALNEMVFESDFAKDLSGSFHEDVKDRTLTESDHDKSNVTLKGYEEEDFSTSKNYEDVDVDTTVAPIHLKQSYESDNWFKVSRAQVSNVKPLTKDTFKLQNEPERMQASEFSDSLSLEFDMEKANEVKEKNKQFVTELKNILKLRREKFFSELHEAADETDSKKVHLADALNATNSIKTPSETVSTAKNTSNAFIAASAMNPSSDKVPTAKNTLNPFITTNVESEKVPTAKNTLNPFITTNVDSEKVSTAENTSNPFSTTNVVNTLSEKLLIAKNTSNPFITTNAINTLSENFPTAKNSSNLFNTSNDINTLSEKVSTALNTPNALNNANAKNKLNVLDKLNAGNVSDDTLDMPDVAEDKSSTYTACAPNLSISTALITLKAKNLTSVEPLSPQNVSTFRFKIKTSNVSNKSNNLNIIKQTSMDIPPKKFEDTPNKISSKDGNMEKTVSNVEHTSNDINISNRADLSDVSNTSSFRNKYKSSNLSYTGNTSVSNCTKSILDSNKSSDLRSISCPRYKKHHFGGSIDVFDNLMESMNRINESSHAIRNSVIKSKKILNDVHEHVIDISTKEKNRIAGKNKENVTPNKIIMPKTSSSSQILSSSSLNTSRNRKLCSDGSKSEKSYTASNAFCHDKSVDEICEDVMKKCDNLDISIKSFASYKTTDSADTQYKQLDDCEYGSTSYESLLSRSFKSIEETSNRTQSSNEDMSLNKSDNEFKSNESINSSQDILNGPVLNTSSSSLNKSTLGLILSSTLIQGGNIQPEKDNLQVSIVEKIDGLSDESTSDGNSCKDYENFAIGASYKNSSDNLHVQVDRISKVNFYNDHFFQQRFNNCMYNPYCTQDIPPENFPEDQYSTSRSLPVELIGEKFYTTQRMKYQPPENDLQKNSADRVLSEHQLRVQRSLQKLNLPEWYKNSPLPREGFLLKKRGSDASPSHGWAAHISSGLNGKTTSLGSLGGQSTGGSSLSTAPGAITKSPLSLAPQSSYSFTRWSTSRLNSAQTSPCSSARSSVRSGPSTPPSPLGGTRPLLRPTRQPYLGWRSQERLATPRTPHERLAVSLLPQSPPVSSNVSAEIQSSIKEVTNAIVHYVSNSNEPSIQETSSSSNVVNRQGSPRLWLESSFVGTKPLESPQTPVVVQPTPVHAHTAPQQVSSLGQHPHQQQSQHQSNRPLQLDLPNLSNGSGGTIASTTYQHDWLSPQRNQLLNLAVSRPSPGSTTLEDVLDSLLGLPSSAPRAPSPQTSPRSPYMLLGLQSRHQERSGSQCSSLHLSLSSRTDTEYHTASRISGDESHDSSDTLHQSIQQDSLSHHHQQSSKTHSPIEHKNYRIDRINSPDNSVVRPISRNNHSYRPITPERSYHTANRPQSPEKITHSTFKPNSPERPRSTFRPLSPEKTNHSLRSHSPDRSFHQFKNQSPDRTPTHHTFGPQSPEKTYHTFRPQSPERTHITFRPFSPDRSVHNSRSQTPDKSNHSSSRPSYSPERTYHIFKPLTPERTSSATFRPQSPDKNYHQTFRPQSPDKTFSERSAHQTYRSQSPERTVSTFKPATPDRTSSTNHTFRAQSPERTHHNFRPYSPDKGHHAARPHSRTGPQRLLDEENFSSATPGRRRSSGSSCSSTIGPGTDGVDNNDDVSSLTSVTRSRNRAKSATPNRSASRRQSEPVTTPKSVSLDRRVSYDPNMAENIHLESSRTSLSDLQQSKTSLKSIASINTDASEEMLVHCRYTKCTSATTQSEAKRHYKSCHNCSYTYCSRECRRAHWEKHRKVCLHSRASALCKQILSTAKECADSWHHISVIAQKGYLTHGRGVVKAFFTSPEAAEKFLSNGFQSLGEPIFVKWPDLMPNEMGPELYAELVKLCKSYNPETRLVLYVAVCVISEVPTKGAVVKWERQLVSRCAKMRLSKTVSGLIPHGQMPFHLSPKAKVKNKRYTKEECRTEVMETLILTSNSANIHNKGSISVQKLREISFNNIQAQLSQRGVNLKKHYPEVYSKLCAYVEGSCDKFAPMTVYPRNNLTGKSFMCVIMPETEPDKFNTLPSDGMQCRTVDVSLTTVNSNCDDGRDQVSTPM